MLFILNFLIQLSICERSFKIVGNEFIIDGKPFQYLSGSFHYFRQNPEYWEETMKEIRYGGCNCIQTYIAWNLHEPQKGQYNFEGMADIERFFQLANKYGLYIILRPGPYICSEWDLGALPYWLLREKDIILRSSDPVYMGHMTDWFTVLFNKVKPYMYHNGGNIIMVQVENEYGSYKGCDHEYMKAVCDITESILGSETLLFTTDGPADWMLKCGSISERALATVDFGTLDSIESSFKIERKYNNETGPLVNSEFYTGKLDHWLEKHNKVAAERVTSHLDKMLSMGANVNMYMYFGGTNFFFYNGANGGANEYQPDPTSYDHDAPLSEAGDMTYKFEEIRKIAKKYFDVPDYEVSNTTKMSYGKVEFVESVSLFDALPIIGIVSEESEKPLTMEDLNVDFGFVLYQSKFLSGKTISIPHCKDRGYVMLNKKLQCIVQHAKEKDCTFDSEFVFESENQLDILVENQGRLNYGNDFFEMKGITEGVKIDGNELNGWKMTGFNLSNIKDLKFDNVIVKKVPAFYRGFFEVGEVADTFLNPTGWTHGTVFINGFNIGRYWVVGPQLTLYIPKHILKNGTNEIIVFEYESQFDTVPPMTFDDVHQIDII